MESRKYQLRKQIIEAIEAKDNDLYSLLKSQWAHRFGVESLEELKNLDLTNENESSNNEENQSKAELGDVNEGMSIDDNNHQEIDIPNETKEEVKSVEVENEESLGIKSYEIVGKKNDENKGLDQMEGIQNQQKVKALIPLPPKPKYGYLKKWLLSN